MDSVDIVVRKALPKASIKVYLEGHGLSEPSSPIIPALYRDSYQEVSRGAFVNGSIDGILLGYKIRRTCQVQLLHASGNFKDIVMKALLKSIKDWSSQLDLYLQFDESVTTQ